MADNTLGAGIATSIGVGVMGGLMRRKQRENQEAEKALANSLSVFTMALTAAKESGNSEAQGMIISEMMKAQTAHGSKDVKKVLEGVQPFIQALVKGGPSGAEAVKQDVKGVEQQVQTGQKPEVTPENDPNRAPLYPSDAETGEKDLESQQRRVGLARRLAQTTGMGEEQAQAQFGIKPPPTEHATDIPYAGTDAEGKASSAKWVQSANNGQGAWIGEDGKEVKGFRRGNPPAATSFQREWVQYKGQTRLAMIDPKSREIFIGGQKVDEKDITRPPSQAQSAGGAGGGANDLTPVTALRPDPKVGNIPDRLTGQTPNMIFQYAIQAALTKTMPSLGLGSAGQVRATRTAITNKAAAMATAAGTTLPALQTEYSRYSKTLNILTPRYSLLKSSSVTANENLNLALEKSDVVGRSGSRVVNRFWQSLQGALTGPPDLAQFETFVYTGAREYARVTTGGAASIAQLNVAAAKKADELINVAQNPEAFASVVEAMNNDMANVTGPLKDQIDQQSGIVGNFLAAVYGGEEGSGGGGGGGKTFTFQGVTFTSQAEMDAAKDAYAKLVRAHTAKK